MSWAKLDDRFWSNRKVRQAWKRNRASIGLHVMAITYCAMHETDGIIDDGFVDDMIPDGRERKGAVNTLLTVGLWSDNGTQFVINDYLDYNRSRAEAERDREQKADRQRKWRESRRVSNASTDASTRRHVDDAPTRPDPTRPINPPSPPPAGGRKREREAWEKDVLAWVRDLGIDGHSKALLWALNGAKPWDNPGAAEEQIRAFIARNPALDVTA